MKYVVLIYMIWAIYSGWKFIDGRSEFLDKKKLPNIIMKLISAYLIGIVYGAIYLIMLILKLIGVG